MALTTWPPGLQTRKVLEVEGRENHHRTLGDEPPAGPTVGPDARPLRHEDVPALTPNKGLNSHACGVRRAS